MEFFFFPSDEAFFMHGFHSPHSEECCYQATGITMTQVLSFSLSVSLSSSDRGFCTLSSIMLNGTCCKFSMNLLHYRYIYIFTQSILIWSEFSSFVFSFGLFCALPSSTSRKTTWSRKTTRFLHLDVNTYNLVRLFLCKKFV